MKKNIAKGLSCTAAFLLMVSITATVLGNQYEGSVNGVLGVQTGSVSGTDGEIVYQSDYTDDGLPSDEGMYKLLQAEDEFNYTAMAESAVLVYNNGALPLASSVKKVSLLGRAVVDPVYRCSSAGPTIDENRVIGLTTAMENAGFQLNQTLLDAYSASGVIRSSSTSSIGEVPVSFYSSSLQSTFSDYGDAAIIMFSRYAGEGIDLSKADADGVSQLSLHEQESDLLKLVKNYKDSGVFKNVIVLINSAYAMELDWIYDEQYGVDACMWIGNPGLTGFSAIPALLTGDETPSGHFVDTFATDSLSAPATQNMGETAFTNNYRTYAVYAESIYVGYKYYETRYEDLILSRFGADGTYGTFASSGGWNYAEEMTFPFGYGLSYTTFSQTLDSVTWDDDGTITVEVTVTNTGNVAGKSVVQVYAQVPYTAYDMENLVEKSAIQLLDFGKTDLLEAGESQTITVEADQYLLASWDSTAHGGAGGYILDDGTYYIAIGDDVHDALNNILAAKGAAGLYDQQGNPVEGDTAKAAAEEKTVFDDTTYRYSEYSGNAVENQFDSDLFAVDYNHYYEGTVTYLTRQDWSTYPETITGLQISDRMVDIHDGDFYEELTAQLDEPEEYTLSVDSGLLFIDMVDVSWSDEETWTKFLCQLSVEELALIVSDSWGQKAVTTVAKPQNYQCDGPDGGSTKYKYGDKGNNTTYVNQGTMACSWNKELIRQRGDFIAEDAFYNNTNCTMAPGVDIHRTPYSGRNHEYYSEDSVLSYLMGAVQCKAMQEKGTVAMLKHVCGNDQETNRKGLCEFMTEQSLREISLKGFEGCLTEGGAMSAMASFACLGVCKAARNYALLTNVLRGEWDWKGFIDTDANDCIDTPALAIVSGTDEFCLTSAINKEVAQLAATDDYLLDALMKTNKRFYYTYLRSNLINGLTRDTVVSTSMAWWQISLIAADVVTGVLTLAFCGIYLYLLCPKKERADKAKGENGNE